MQKLTPITLGAPGDEIGKKDLAAIKRRFQHLHNLRFQRILEIQQPRQRIFLELLPLIFHRNYPALPGYLSSKTPAGIQDYNPNKRALGWAKNLSKSFVYRKRALRQYPIQGIFLMGSVGSIAYSKKSDLDIWLCHQSDLKPEKLRSLQEKAEAIEQWAASLGLEAHFFLIDAERFRAGEGCPISAESSGSTQHHLLLEEFYRTAIQVAGRIPAWWLVPPEQDVNYPAYIEHLTDNRFVDDKDIIDLGGLEGMPSHEFLGASLWHFCKALNAPHKSLLKLLMIEAYAREYPNIDWLCSRLKRLIYKGTVDMDVLDPYIVMYQKVEDYLIEGQESDRLTLARHCFYYKINELLSDKSRAAQNHYRRNVLQRMIDQWDWDEDYVRQLDQRKNWKVQKALDEQQAIINELSRSYQTLSGFAREFADASDSESFEIKLLGRKLHSSLEKKPGKIEKIYCDTPGQLVEDKLSFHEIVLADGEVGWALYADHVKGNKAVFHAPLRKARSLLELLCWVALNGLYRKTTNIFLETRTSNLPSVELQAILTSLNSLLHGGLAATQSLDAYMNPPFIESSALFINVAYDAVARRRDGMLVTSDRSDALSYGSSRANLIQTIDQVTLTSWGEVQISSYTGVDGLFDCLAELINQPSAPLLECYCYSSSRAGSIARRGREIYDSLALSFFEVSQNSPMLRYVVRGADKFYIFQRDDNVLKFRSAASLDDLYEELGSPQPQYSPVRFDRFALEQSPIPFLSDHNIDGLVQLFFVLKKQHADLYIFDERGSLFQKHTVLVDGRLLLDPYANFLESILQRHVLSAQLEVRYYQVSRRPSGDYALEAIQFNAMSQCASTSIRVFGEETSPLQIAFTIYCNEREFSSMEYGDSLFNRVAEYILDLRSGNDAYPIYITDIDVPYSILGIDAASQLQTIHFLNYKEKIESRLNLSVQSDRAIAGYF